MDPRSNTRASNRENIFIPWPRRLSAPTHNSQLDRTLDNQRGLGNAGISFLYTTTYEGAAALRERVQMSVMHCVVWKEI